MIRALPRFVSNQRLIFVALGVTPVGAGLYAFEKLKIEAYPDISDTQAVATSLYPGHAAGEVEQQVTAPVERALNNSPNVIARRSRTIFGLSIVEPAFADPADDYFARQVALEKLRDVSLPDGVTPSLGPLTSGGRNGDQPFRIQFKAPANDGIYAPCRNQDWAEFFDAQIASINCAHAGAGFYGEI
jgi:cobalt-zinc-cadmium resistance protein CzcA